MTTIHNKFTYPVILADKRDPNISWQHHIARGSAGGVDLAYPMGAAVKSPADGVFKYVAGKGSGGNIGQVRLADGRTIELMHLSAPVAASGSRVVAGQEIAKSGGSGFGKPNHYAPHLHVHLLTVTGTRVNIFNNFGEKSSANEIDGTVEADEWVKVQRWLKTNWGYTGATDGAPGSLTFSALQRFLKAQWGYTGTITGVMNIESYKALQRFLKAKHGYTGVVDGIPGKQTWSAFQRFTNTI